MGTYVGSQTSEPTSSGSPWPAELTPVFAGAVTAEFASLTRAGHPVTVPTTPYLGTTVGAGTPGTLSVSTGLAYTAKAERARRDPRVSLLFADPVGSTVDRPAVVLVQGLATVRDADLQANTDHYVRATMAKLPAAYRGQPRFALRRMPWYFARVWIDVTPLRIRWWLDRTLSGAPSQWRAPDGTTAPASDPAPRGDPLGAWLPAPGSWAAVADDALGRLRLHDLTVVGEDGFPATFPVTVTGRDERALVLAVGAGGGGVAAGPACLTAHAHPEAFTGQENRTFVGRFEPAPLAAADAGPAGSERRGRLVVERALADWSLAGSKPRMVAGFLGAGRRLRPRLRIEAERRGQPVPQVRFSGDRGAPAGTPGPARAPS